MSGTDQGRIKMPLSQLSGWVFIAAAMGCIQKRPISVEYAYEHCRDCKRCILWISRNLEVAAQVADLEQHAADGLSNGRPLRKGISRYFYLCWIRSEPVWIHRNRPPRLKA